MEDQNQSMALLVLNREKGRFFTYENQRLEEQESFESSKSHYTDNRDSFQLTSTGDAPMSYGSKKEKHRVQEHDLELFMSEVERRLRNYFKNKKFTQLILIAPAEVQKPLYKKMNQDLIGSIDQTIDANLVNQSWQEIQKYTAAEIDDMDTERI